MKTYKVWVHIEEIDDEEDTYLEDFEGSRLPEILGEFSGLLEAHELVDAIKTLIKTGSYLALRAIR